MTTLLQAIQSDLVGFINPQEFAEDCLFFTPKMVSVKAIIDQEYVTDQNVSGVITKMMVRTAQVSAVKTGDRCKIRDKDYTVCQPPQSDGTGISTVYLERVYQ